MIGAGVSAGPLAGIRVLDLSRVLAGPWSAQMLGDLGAEVIKVEQPGQGDDTRRWGPPFLPDGSGDSAYYLCANRNKRSIAVDMATEVGAATIRELAARSDVVIENFRAGGLAKYGLDYPSLAAVKGDIIYCSITGFGQTGPDRDKGGYDFLIQGMSGLMSVTGTAEGGPMKVGVPISDLVTGLYATISVLAALQHRQRTGEGQHIDLALLDAQVALLSNQASMWLNGGVEPQRMGNQHPNMVPYQDFRCADGDILVALGNDRQFRDFAQLLDLGDLAGEEQFATVAARNANRGALLDRLRPVVARWPSADLLAAMDAAKLPGGKVATIPEALGSPQIAARGLVQDIARADGTPVRFVGFPAKFSATPATYRQAPPLQGADTAEILGVLARLAREDSTAAAFAGRGIEEEDA